ncbi:methyltransferase domain-containing protein [Deinococcus sp. HMF7620]|uniref:Methyltransferase domain-containing protein n=1 Tax=Deinococcus arboris TaxID=2682977 RepID=A0A7C9HUF6_9DEIO|nr:class I SAM-dependent methyltransferase [Deinococcus arboris]MVN89314.1 methyltransferase domain-containing protein [Deinococcus arboris]
MTPRPHSREWYAALARDLGGYRHPWTRVLDGPDPELIYDLLLTTHLTPQTRVLEAGCGHGPDAARFGDQAARWAAYDHVPELLALARQHAPQADFHDWNGKGAVPPALRGPFDLIVSRRGPTGIIRHLPEVAAPQARFLYVGPRLTVPQVQDRLAAVGWTVLGQWQISVQARVPTREDWATRCAWMEEPERLSEWDAQATAAGLPYREERLVVLAGASG